MAEDVVRILIAEDDFTSRIILSTTLKRGDYEVVEVTDGTQAWDVLSRDDAPKLAVLERTIPGMDGHEIVKRLRGHETAHPPYIIMLTSKGNKQDMIDGLTAGADDYLIRPFDRREFLARVEVGRRMLEVRDKLVVQTVELQQTHTQLAHAQKLEAVGQLAAGIAHEINTPTQFVSDSVFFIKEAFDDIQQLHTRYREAIQTLIAQTCNGPLAAMIEEAEEDADLEYIMENLPASFDRCADGLSRIAAIVGAMKEFAHPDWGEQAPSDINQAIQATLTISKSEYKYVADVETELAPLPPVICHIGELNQVFLNLLVNAAHAIEDVVASSRDRGTIRVRTSHGDDMVRLEFTDTGGGIPKDVQDRIFNPFFTTKEVGRGSGQGLAIARSIIEDKHGGILTFDTNGGLGTTFIIQLPVGGKVD